MTLVGFLRGRSFNVYGERSRVTGGESPKVRMPDAEDPRRPGRRRRAALSAIALDAAQRGRAHGRCGAALAGALAA